MGKGKEGEQHAFFISVPPVEDVVEEGMREDFWQLLQQVGAVSTKMSPVSDWRSDVSRPGEI